jgi:hypothetical protein
MRQWRLTWRGFLAFCLMFVAVAPGLAKPRSSPAAAQHHHGRLTSAPGTHSHGRSAFAWARPGFPSGRTEPRYYPAYRFGWWEPAYYPYPYDWAEIQATRVMVRMP